MQNSQTPGRSTLFANERRRSEAIVFVGLIISVSGCGGGLVSSSSTSSPPPSPSLSSISVNVTPNPVTVIRGATQAFSATVKGTDNGAVTWSVLENFGGTIDGTGLYSAPRDSEGTFHVVATSQADPTARGMAAAVVPVPQVTISPAAITMPPNGAQNFTVTLSGLAHTEVTWSIRESTGGLINGAGFYTAPGAVGFYHVVATSVEDAAITATVTISVTSSAVSFTPTGSLQRARGFHTATLLMNGKVLVAGGANRGSDKLCPGGITSAELYDPATGLFASTGVLTRARFAHTATLLQDGKVLVIGGFGDAFDCSDLGLPAEKTAELYDPVTGFFKKTGSMGSPRGWHTATLLTDGRVLVTGGNSEAGSVASATAELYDPGTGAFTPTGSMTVARFQQTATLLKNGKVLIVGGASGDPPSPTATAELYDPATGTFAVTGSLMSARQEHTATLLADGKVLIAGGETHVISSSDLQATATAEVYDAAVGSFSPAGLMIISRNAHTATLLPNGATLITGGGLDSSTAELYDPTTGSFSITGGMEVGRIGHSATLLPRGSGLTGSVLVIGGGTFSPIATAELYAPAGNGNWDY